MKEEIKRWFVEKIAQTPEYLEKVYLLEIEREIRKAEDALHQAIRNDSIEAIKYRMGWLDGMQRLCAVIEGLKLSETKKPAEPGLMARIFGKDNKAAPDIPANLG